VEALPQFKHSAAAVPSTPSSNRNALPPQCGHMNFIVVSIVSRSTAGAARSCAGVGAAWDDAPGVGDSAPMNAPLQSTRQGLFRSHLRTWYGFEPNCRRKRRRRDKAGMRLSGIGAKMGAVWWNTGPQNGEVQ
jgi:hypothetical protein